MYGWWSQRFWLCVLFLRDCSVAKSLHCSMDRTRGCQSSWEFLGIFSLNSLNEIIWNCDASWECGGWYINTFLLFFYRSVFDVTKGKSHYGSGGGYNHFAGRYALWTLFSSKHFCCCCAWNCVKDLLFNTYWQQFGPFLSFSFPFWHEFRDASRAFVSGNFTGNWVSWLVLVGVFWCVWII